MTEIRRRIRLTDDPLPEAEPAPVAPAPARPNQNRRKLTDEQVDEMRLDWEADQMTNAEIAEKYGCSESLVRYHARQRGWRRPEEIPTGEGEAHGLVSPTSFRERHPDAWGSLQHPASQAVICRAIEDGQPRSHAASLVGCTREGLRLALERDRDFRKGVEAAEAWFTYGQVVKAGQGRAADSRKWVESHPATREDFGRVADQPQTIIINGFVDRRAPRQLQQHETPIIEGSFERLPPDGDRAEPLPAVNPDSQD